MSEIKVLFFVLIFAYASKTIYSLSVKINLSGKSNLKTFQESCVSNGDCGYGLKCIKFECRCLSDEYWNSTNCETKLALYFKTTNYSTITVNQYNGTGFFNVMNIAIIEKPTYYIYVGDKSTANGLIARYDEFGSYINHIPLSGVFGIQPINNTKIYVSSWTTTTMYIFDTNLNLNNSKDTADPTYVSSPRYLRYNPSNGYFYVTDATTRYVNAFDLAYNLIASECFKPGGTPFGTSFYQNSTHDNLILVTTQSNTIKIVRQSDRTVYKTLNSVCSSSYPFSVFVHQKSGYVLVSCFIDNLIQLWLTDGIDFVYTGKTLSIPYPAEVSLDSNMRLLVANSLASSFSILTLS